MGTQPKTDEQLADEAKGLAEDAENEEALSEQGKAEAEANQSSEEE